MKSTLNDSKQTTTSLDPDQTRRWLVVLIASQPKELQAQLNELDPHVLRAPVLQLCESLGFHGARAPAPPLSSSLETKGNILRWFTERAPHKLCENGRLTLVERLVIVIERRFRGHGIELRGELEQVLSLRRDDHELWSSRSADLAQLKAILQGAASEGRPQPRPPEVLIKPRSSAGRLLTAGLFSILILGLPALWRSLIWHQSLAELELGPRPELALLLRSYGATPQSLEVALAAENPWLRTNALLALDPARDIASIRPFLSDPAGLVRLTALRIGLRAEDPETLRRALQSPFPELRGESLRALRENPESFSSELEAWSAAPPSAGLSRVQVLRCRARSLSTAALQDELARELPGLRDPAEVLAWIHAMSWREAWTPTLEAAIVQKLSGLEASGDEDLALTRWRERLNDEPRHRGE